MQAIMQLIYYYAGTCAGVYVGAYSSGDLV
jgi:hypothetical protein